MQSTRNSLPKALPLPAWQPWIAFFAAWLLLTACTTRAATQELISVTITDQEKTLAVDVTSGTNVQGAIQQAGLSLATLDRTEPPTFTLITAPARITIYRVTEEFEVEEQDIPFQHQTVRNETLPEGQTLLIQPGENGVQHITYRRLVENGVEVARTVFKNEVATAPIPEIVMIGVQAPFAPLSIPGRLVYLSGGNAWRMDTTTTNRTPVIVSGDLDGRVFTLSPDRTWLLFTRSAPGDDGSNINALWAANLEADPPAQFDLGVRNVIHYAEWSPGEPQTVYFSTVEPRTAAPGWQANNDLRVLTFGQDGTILAGDELIGANTGGIYGWWGTGFSWSPDGSQLAYARPDSIGLVSLADGEFLPLMELLPYQTRADWAWVPGIAWSADSQHLLAVTHQTDSSLANPESSPWFNLVSISLAGSAQNQLAPSSGMFGNPVVSPGSAEPPRLAWLEAVFPEQSGSSRYRLMVMDPDGANKKKLFPPEGSTGLDPQTVTWSPGRQENQPRYLAFIHQGNIWLVDVESGKVQQITGDGLVSRMDWQ